MTSRCKWYKQIPATHFRALGLSLGLALSVAFGACLLGIPAALGVVRGRLPGKSLFLAFFRAPMQIPAVVTGVAFLRLYYVVGDATGLFLNATFVGLYLGHLFVATPYVIGTVVAVLQRFNSRLEEAALSMGASPWRTFRRVTLPTIMPGVHAGALYAFMVSFCGRADRDVPDRSRLRHLSGRTVLRHRNRFQSIGAGVRVVGDPVLAGRAVACPTRHRLDTVVHSRR